MKEQYIKMRNENRIDAAVLYTFAREQTCIARNRQYGLNSAF